MAYTIEKPANNKKGWRKLPDCRFDSKESALRYGYKYHVGKCGEIRFRVVEIKESNNG